MIKERTKYEVEDLIDKTQIKEYTHPKLLDIGCGGGDHLKWLAQEDYSYLELTGIDKSQDMLNETKHRIGKNNSQVRLIKKDVHDDDIFMRSSFSHITCYYFTLYYVNSKVFMENIRYWLKPNGWFVVHVVDLEKFDPVLDAASPFRGINPQKYVKNRITESTVHFKSSFTNQTLVFETKMPYMKKHFNSKIVLKYVHKHTNYKRLILIHS